MQRALSMLLRCLAVCVLTFSSDDSGRPSWEKVSAQKRPWNAMLCTQKAVCERAGGKGGACVCVRGGGQGRCMCVCARRGAGAGRKALHARGLCAHPPACLHALAWHTGTHMRTLKHTPMHTHKQVRTLVAVNSPRGWYTSLISTGTMAVCQSLATIRQSCNGERVHKVWACAWASAGAGKRGGRQAGRQASGAAGEREGAGSEACVAHLAGGKGQGPEGLDGCLAEESKALLVVDWWGGGRR